MTLTWTLDARAPDEDLAVVADGVFSHGLALVAPAHVTRTEGCWMEQFFILKRFRRKGAGFALARHVLHQHPGPWEVGQMPANTAAQAFWRQTVSALTAGKFLEVEVKEGCRTAVSDRERSLTP